MMVLSMGQNHAYLLIPGVGIRCEVVQPCRMMIEPRHLCLSLDHAFSWLMGLTELGPDRTF